MKFTNYKLEIFLLTQRVLALLEEQDYLIQIVWVTTHL